MVRYTTFWIMLLISKLAFNYYVEVWFLPLYFTYSYSEVGYSMCIYVFNVYLGNRYYPLLRQQR